ncbi:MAG: RloB domain-containing protein [Alphaproteobacteria bacterium]|nr:RloB domain-containing protein [Alphaproteobacteria bacterium]
MGRKNKPFNRDETPKLPFRKVFLIATEGKTEGKYLSKLNERFGDIARFEIIPIPPIEKDGSSSPKGVLNRLNKEKKNSNKNYKDNDCWLFLDVDRWDKTGEVGRCGKLQEVITLCEGKNNYNIAISNPCFEVWLCMHQNNFDEKRANKKCTPQECKDCFGALRKEIGDTDYETLLSNLQSAVENARRLENNHKIPDKPGSSVYKLVEELQIDNNS